MRGYIQNNIEEGRFPTNRKNMEQCYQQNNRGNVIENRFDDFHGSNEVLYTDYGNTEEVGKCII